MEPTSSQSVTESTPNIGGVAIGGISGGTVEIGDIQTNITAQEIIGRDKIVTNITRIINQARSAVQEAVEAEKFAQQKLAEGVQDYLHRLRDIALVNTDADRGGPYRGLLAYRLCDAELFFGRDEAVHELLAHMQRGPLTILHAQSGAGKTSLLQAGIAYRLLNQGHLPVYIRPYNQSPSLAIKRAFVSNLADVPELAEASLHDFLGQVSGILGSSSTLYLLIDQFEEVFTLLDEAARCTFVNDLAECLEDESFQVCWVLALRTEFFGDLANFRPRIRNPFENDYRLNCLTPEEARIVITQPAARQQPPLSLEPELVDLLINDLRDPDSGELVPPQIQLVCSALYNTFQERYSQNSTLPLVITRQLYHEEGEAKGILQGHLNRVLSRTLKPQEREVARQLLIALVSSDQRRLRRTKSDLTAILAVYLTSAVNLDGLLDQLVDSRLLREEEDEQTQEPTYELAHDYLVTRILDPDIQARKAAEELLNQQLFTFKQYGTLLSVEELAIITSQLKFLRLDDAANKLLSQSQAAHRRARFQKYGAIGLVLLSIVGAALSIAILQTRSAEQQRVLAESAQAAATRALQAEETARAEAERAKQAEVMAQAEAERARRAETTAQAEAERAKRAETTAQVEADRAINAEATAQAEASRAIDAEATAKNLADVARAREMAAQARTALDEGRPQRSLLLAVEAIAATSEYGGRSYLLAAEQTLRRALASLKSFPLAGQQGEIVSMAASPNGRWLLIGEADGLARLWDLTGGDPATTSPRVLDGHTDRIEMAGFSPDSRWAVTSSSDTTVRLWDLTADDPAAHSLELRGHQGPVRAAVFSPNNRWLATGSDDTVVRLWDMTAGKPAAHFVELRGHTQLIRALAFSPDNHWLATGSKDETVRLWDLTGEDFSAPAIVLAGHTGGVRELDMSADSRGLIASNEGTAWLWDLNTLAASGRKMVLQGSNAVSNDEQGIRAVALSSDNRWVAAGTGTGTIRLWDTNDLAHPRTLIGHTAAVWAVTFSPDNKWLVTGSDDSTIRLWSNLTSASPVSRLLTDHDEAIQYLAVTAGAGTGTPWLVSTSSDHTARWQPLTLQPTSVEPLTLAGHERPISALAFSSDSRWLVTGSEDNTARLWALAAPDPAAQPRSLTGHKWRINAVAVSPDNHWVVTASDDHDALLWNLAEIDDPLSQPRRLSGHQGAIQTAAFSPDGHWLATGSWDKQAWLWDMTAGDPAARPIRLTGHAAKITHLAFSADNRWLVTASADGTARLWDLRADDPAAAPLVFAGHRGAIRVVALSPDNHWLATGGDDKVVRLWDLTGPDPAAYAIELYGHVEAILALAFSPNSAWLVSGSGDKTGQLWNMATVTDPTAFPLELRGHKKEITTVAFSPDNHWLATGSNDKTVRLWDLTAPAPAAEALVLNDHQAEIRAVAFSPDNHWLVTADNTGLAKRWTLRLDELLELACRLVGRNLTYEEWTRYMRLGEYHQTCANLPPHHTLVNHILEIGERLAAQGKLVEAAARFQQALELNPTLKLEPETRTRQIFHQAMQKLITQAEELARAGHVEQAAVIFQKVKDLDPSLPLEPRTEAQRLAQPTFDNAVGAAVALAAKGDSEGARTGFLEALKFAANLNLAPAWHQLCVAGGRWQQAGVVSEACDRAINLEPDNGEYYLSRGIVRLQLGDVAGARQDLAQFDAWLRQKYNPVNK